MKFDNIEKFFIEIKIVFSKLLCYVKHPDRSRHDDFELVIFPNQSEEQMIYVFCPKFENEDFVIFFGKDFGYTAPKSDRLFLDIAMHSVAQVKDHVKRYY